MPLTRRRALLAGLAPLAAQSVAQNPSDRIERRMEQWGVFEAAIPSGIEGNPFLDVTFAAEFRHEHRIVSVNGFYDGGGIWRVRFSPDSQGEWTWTTRSNRGELNAKTGRFACTAPAPGNHGPVSVRNTWHFSYADGTRYFPFGTTCYAWTHQSDELEDRTLATLRDAGFNKIRMCIFPKWYTFNQGVPPRFPFERSPAGENDYTRFNPAFFQHLEQRVARLGALGIEADLILFHPYDNWGFSKMPPDADGRYLRYAVARLAAYRNVWWSIANEWDLVKTKNLADWDGFFRIVQEDDPYSRLRSIHHSKVMYDHGKPWVSHASIQDDDFSKTAGWLDAYRKPVIHDECKYEGNIPQRWGNLPAQEMVRRFWLAVTAGAYGGHGETYLDAGSLDADVLWWSKGGVLHGESAPRIAFLRRLLEEGPSDGLNAVPNAYYPAAGKTGEYYLHYLDYHQPAEHEFTLPAETQFYAEIIDPWAMTTDPLPGAHSGKTLLKLPGQALPGRSFPQSSVGS